MAKQSIGVADIHQDGYTLEVSRRKETEFIEVAMFLNGLFIGAVNLEDDDARKVGQLLVNLTAHLAVNNQTEFLHAYRESIGDYAATTGTVKRNAYKYVDCGPWIDFEPDRIIIGSIVEGADVDVVPVELVYPFDFAEFDKALVTVNAEAVRLWDEWNA